MFYVQLQVTNHPAIKEIAKAPIIVVDGVQVASGGGGVLGHPIKFINLELPVVKTCGYSGRRFIQKKFYDPIVHGTSMSLSDYDKQSNLLGFGTRPVDIIFTLKEEDPGRRSRSVKLNDRTLNLPIYVDREDVIGKVEIILKKPGSRIDHQGVRVEFVGQIESLVERSGVHEFVALSKLLAYPGELTSNTILDFAFIDAEKPHESYYGNNVRLRYLLRLTIIKRFGNITLEEDLYVERYSTESKITSSKISMEVGIEDSLHIEFEYIKSSFHLNDIIVGRIYFSLVRIKIKYLELNIVRNEIIGPIGGSLTDSEIVGKYEILDGAPLKGETIPIRLFLAPFKLSPTMKDVLQKFTVSYAINLILVDEEDRRYFKQQDITLWRRKESEFIKLNERVCTVPTFKQPAVEGTPATQNGNTSSVKNEQMNGSILNGTTIGHPSTHADSKDTQIAECPTVQCE